MAKPTGTIRAYLHTVVYYAFKAHLWASKFMPQDTLERGKKERKKGGKKEKKQTQQEINYSTDSLFPSTTQYVLSVLSEII